MKLLTKYTITTAVFAVAALAVSAETLTPEQALARATQATGKHRVQGRGESVQPRLIYTVNDSASQKPAVYVFGGNAGQGFMVVSADDCGRALLGYADNGTFDAANIPPSMQWWLESYSKQIGGASAAGNAGSARVASGEGDYQAIPPMVKTRWNQSSPYNDRCPVLYGSHSVTGCFATAEAQVLNYLKYPANGAKGIVSYKWSKGGKTLTADLDTIPFRWDKMLNYYDANSPAENKLAVADLMLACGLMSGMDYSPSSSGATSADGAMGMYKYMGCTEASIVLGSWFNQEKLNAFVYDYLTKHGPMLYCGQSTTGGHAFVCDGYSQDDFFHFNWGWGGMSDGYFQLNALNPGSQGIGGSSSGYNFNQQLITGLHTPGPKDQFEPVVGADGGVFIDPDFNGVPGDTILLESRVENGGFFNFSMDTITVSFGLCFERTATGEKTYEACYGIKGRELPSLRGWSAYPVVIPKTLEKGTYTLTAAYSANGRAWKDMYVEQTEDTYVLMTYDGDSVKFERPQPAPVRVSDMTLETPLHSGSAMKMKAAITATSDREFYGKVAVAFGEYYGEDFVSDFQGETMLIGAKPGELKEFSYTTEIGNKRLKGEYSMVFINVDNFTIISEPVKVNVSAYVAPVIEVVNAKIPDAEGVDPNDVRVAFDLKCTAGYFTTPLLFNIGTIDGSGKFKSISKFQSPTPFVAAGSTESMNFGGGFAPDGSSIYYGRVEIYDAATRKYKALCDYMPFTLKTEGVSDVEAEGIAVSVSVDGDVVSVSAGETIEKVEVYDMGGRTVARLENVGSQTAELTVAAKGNLVVKVVTAGGSATQKMSK